MGYEPIARSGEFTRRLVPGQARENQFLDFKRDPWNQTEKRECASDVAQFANASGGVLVIGADEQDHVLSGFKAVPRPDELLRWVDDVLKGHLEPVPPIDPHILNGPVGEAVVVMNIPPSLALVARKAGEGYEFPIRRVDSKGYMRLMEVETRMDNTERLMKLRLQRIASTEVVLLDAPISGTDEKDWRVVEVDDDVVRLMKHGLHVDVPLAYVQAVYPTPEPEARWVLALSAHIWRYGPSGGSPEHLLVRRGRQL